MVRAASSRRTGATSGAARMQVCPVFLLTPLLLLVSCTLTPGTNRVASTTLSHQEVAEGKNKSVFSKLQSLRRLLGLFNAKTGKKALFCPRLISASDLSCRELSGAEAVVWNPHALQGGSLLGPLSDEQQPEFSCLGKSSKVPSPSSALPRKLEEKPKCDDINTCWK